ncbi:type II toxin-antitoxin system VapB family antitoxin, partial [Nostoc sp. NIES-2111]
TMKPSQPPAPRKTAKLFQNGRSQAVRLPVEFRFEGKEVYIRKDPKTGEVILSPRPNDWASFFARARKANVPADFMKDRDTSPPRKFSF